MIRGTQITSEPEEHWMSLKKGGRSEGGGGRKLDQKKGGFGALMQNK